MKAILPAGEFNHKACKQIHRHKLKTQSTRDLTQADAFIGVQA